MTETEADRDQMGDDTEGAANQDNTLSKDEIFHVLQNDRRRRVLQYLVDTDGPVQMGDIAEQITAWEYGTNVEEITSEQRQRVYIALYQSHLPKLAEFGLVTYNQHQGIVEQTPHINQVTRYLDQDETPSQSENTTRKWTWYYAYLTGINILLISLTWLDSGLISLLLNGRLALIITLLYASMTVAMAADSY